MNRLKLFILIFFVAISIPLAFVIWQTYSSLEQEELGQLQFFSEALFDQMEKELADLVEKEENRAVDDYGHFIAGSDGATNKELPLSPLASEKYQDYILGYLQNNPDGSFQTPMLADLGAVPVDRQDLLLQLENVNQVFNQKKLSIAKPDPVSEITLKNAMDEKAVGEKFSDRYLTKSKTQASKEYLGKKKQRFEEITEQQALNIASDNDAPSSVFSSVLARNKKDGVEATKDRVEAKNERYGASSDTLTMDMVAGENEALYEQSDRVEEGVKKFQVEVAPFQSVSIKDEQVYIFRRIAIDNQIYRQGFILLVEPFLQHLANSHFTKQPLATFTALEIKRRDIGAGNLVVQAGVTGGATRFMADRVFPPPFDFLSVTLRADSVPASPARGSLNIALIVLGFFMFFGLLAIYHSAQTIVTMSEKRTQFVSSVTHELKTPLTNIRMYVEMLEQGIAATPEREQEYLGILGSESARLSGLINNVLELAKLEKKQRQFHMQVGQLHDVLNEVKTVMAEQLKQEGFSLVVKTGAIPGFAYDREVLIQILVNLIENSVKFGKMCAKREITISAGTPEGGGDKIYITVSDTGPGIPHHALKKIFDDFYRIDNKLTRSTGGTGIGLALVRKFTIAMGGTVQASNNPTEGCSITLTLPLSFAPSAGGNLT